MESSERRTELIVGIFLFIGFALLGALILKFGRFSDRLRDHYQLTIVFDDASGLIKGSVVRMGGARIGKVENQPELNEAVKVQVQLSIDERIKIPTGSEFKIASATVLGDKLIDIIPPEKKPDTYIEPGSFIQGGGLSGFDAIQNNAEAVTRDVRRLMQNSEGTLIKIDSAVDDLRAVTGRLGETIEKVNVSILSDKNLANVDATLESWKDASTELKPVLADARTAIDSFRKASDSAEKTFANADKAIADIRPAFQDVPKAVNSISNAADRAGEAIDRAAKSDGLLGTLAYDKNVSTDARTFMKNLRQRGILRYRDQEPSPEDDPRNRFRGKRR